MHIVHVAAMLVHVLRVQALNTYVYASIFVFQAETFTTKKSHLLQSMPSEIKQAQSDETENNFAFHIQLYKMFFFVNSHNRYPSMNAVIPFFSVKTIKKLF